MESNIELTDIEKTVISLDVEALVKIIETKKKINWYFSEHSPYPNYHILKVIALRYNLDKNKSNSFLYVLFKNYLSINEIVDDLCFPSYVVTEVNKPKDLITYLISIDYESKINFKFLIDLFNSNKLSTSKKLDIIDELIKYDVKFRLIECGDFIYTLLSSNEVELSKKIIGLLFIKDNEINNLKKFDIFSILPNVRFSDSTLQDFTYTKESLLEFLITNDVDFTDKTTYINDHINEYKDYYDDSMDSIISVIMESKSNDTFELVKYFLDLGFEIEKEGRSSLIKAVKLGDERLIKLLLNYTFDINFKDKDNKTVLSCLRFSVGSNLDNHFENLKLIVNSVEDEQEIVKFLTTKERISYNELIYKLNFLDVFTRFNNFSKYNDLLDLYYDAGFLIEEIYEEFEILDYINNTKSKDLVYSFVNHQFYKKDITIQLLLKILLSKNLLEDYLSENVLDINSLKYFEFTLVELSNVLGEEVIIEAIETLIFADYDFDINKSYATESYNLSLLEFASSLGLSKLVRYLFNKNAYYSEDFNLLYSVLDVSSVPIAKKRLNTLKVLIELGVNPKDKNHYNVNILMIACYNGCTDIVKYLLSIGLDINDVDKDGNNCMYYTIISQTDFQFRNARVINEDTQINIIKVLIENGFNFDNKIDYYKDLAKKNKRLSVLRFLESL